MVINLGYVLKSYSVIFHAPPTPKKGSIIAGRTTRSLIPNIFGHTF